MDSGIRIVGIWSMPPTRRGTERCSQQSVRLSLRVETTPTNQPDFQTASQLLKPLEILLLVRTILRTTER